MRGVSSKTFKKYYMVVHGAAASRFVLCIVNTLPVTSLSACLAVAENVTAAEDTSSL